MIRKLAAVLVAACLSMPLAYASRHIENVHPESPDPDSYDVFYVSIIRECQVDTEIIQTTTIEETREEYDYSNADSNLWYSSTTSTSYSWTDSEINHEYTSTLEIQRHELHPGESMDFEDSMELETQDLPADEYPDPVEEGDVSNPDRGYWISVRTTITFSGTGSARLTIITYF